MTLENKDQGVVYMLAGAAHAVRLVVSIASLRRHYSGPICIFTTQEESHRIAEHCLNDSRLGPIQHQQIEEVELPKNGHFLTKIQVVMQSPFERTCWLDCDTVVEGNISPLFDALDKEDTEFVATHFSDWVSTGKIISGRINKWNSVKSNQFDTKQLVESALEIARPAINTGVCAVRKNASILQAWYDLSLDGYLTFIPEEVSMQLLLHHYPHAVLDCRYNNSPIYGVKEDVKVWHFHGNRHVVPGKGGDQWIPHYFYALEHNLANLMEWTPGIDGRLRDLLKFVELYQSFNLLPEKSR